MVFKNKKNTTKKDPQQEDTTSSSETSPGSMTRKPKSSYLSRTKPGKSTQNLAKRHVRSSSGYSSHNEETTFRLDFDDFFHFALKFNQVKKNICVSILAYRIIQIMNHICHHQPGSLIQLAIRKRPAVHHEFEPILNCIEKHSK